MSGARGTEQYIRPIAEESLEAFEKIANAAEANLRSGGLSRSPTSIVRNTFTEQKTMRECKRIGGSVAGLSHGGTDFLAIIKSTARLGT